MSRFQLLSDSQWELIAGLLPVRTGKKGRPFRDAHQMVEGIIYRYRFGVAWRDVPAVFGPWQTIWCWHRRMSADGHVNAGAEVAQLQSHPWRAIERSLTGPPPGGC